MVLIDFRYHIVSIVAVFLALGLGILMGTTVLERGTVRLIEGRVDDLRNRLDGAREDISQLRTERDNTQALVDQLAPWATRGALQGTSVLFVFDEGNGGWRSAAEDAIRLAGATDVGSVTITARWTLDGPGADEELTSLISSVTPAFQPVDDTAVSALGLVGARLLEPTGRTLVDRLADAGYLRADRRAEAPWPPAGAVVVAFSNPHPAGAAEPGWIASFARGAAEVTSVLAVAPSTDEPSALDLLREADAPPALATFDTASGPSGDTGVVLALEAAIAGRGGHFGSADGRRFFPEPPPPPDTADLA